MDDQPEVIRQQMAETRSSLTDKIERLEQAVTDRVETTTAAVTDTMESVKDAVKDTVDTVTGTVHETVDSVRGAMSDTAECVRHTLNVPHYFRDYPWAAFGASVAAGYMGGSLFRTKGAHMPRAMPRSRPFFAASPPPSTNGPERPAPPPPFRSNEPSEHQEKTRLISKFEPELQKLKGMAIGTIFGLVRDWIGRSASGPLGDRLGEVIDNVTRKFGGEPFHQNLLDRLTGNGGKVHERDEPSVARSSERATVV